MAKKRGRRGGRIAATRTGPARVVTPTRTAGPDQVEHMLLGEVGEMPEPAEGLTVAPLTGLDRRTLWVPVPAITRVLRVAEEEGLELRFPVDSSRFDLSKSGAIALAHRVTGEGVDYVRAVVKVPTTEVRQDMPVHHQAWVDLPTRYVGMMVEAGTPTGDEKREDEFTIRTGPGRRPHWAGSHTFDKLWDTADSRIVFKEPATREADGSLTTAPAKVFSVHVKTMLSTCHVVRIEAAQMEVLPDWEELSQAHDFAHDLNLPFEPLLLDFEGVGGIAPQMIVKMHEEIESVLVLRGALVSRINEAGALTILPFGDLYLPDVDADSVVTKTARQKALGQDDSSVHPYTPMGSLVFDTIDTGEDRPKFGPQEMAVESGGEHSRKMRSVTTAINTELLGGSPTGMVVLPHQWKDSDRGRMDAIEGWAHATYAAGLRALAALSIMESDFVVVEQADLEHRDIKRAEKRGWKISDQVYVRPTRKGGHYEPTGNTRNYSHRFWVRGHMKHYSLGTRAATHRPDLVKPCTRAGLASCGMCRRIWTPPFIKGPEDKPLVMKSLVKKVE